MEISVWNTRDPENELLFSFESDSVPRIGEDIFIASLHFMVTDVSWQLDGEGCHPEFPRHVCNVSLNADVLEGGDGALLLDKLRADNAKAEDEHVRSLAQRSSDFTPDICRCNIRDGDCKLHPEYVV